MGMYGPDYVWVYSALFNDKWWLSEERRDDCTEAELNKAAEGLFVIGDVFRNPTGARR